MRQDETTQRWAVRYTNFNDRKECWGFGWEKGKGFSVTLRVFISFKCFMGGKMVNPKGKVRTGLVEILSFTCKEWMDF